MGGIYYVFATPPCTGGDYIAVQHIAALIRMGFNAQAFYCSRDEGWRQFTVPVALPGPPLDSRDVFVAGEDQKVIFQGLRNAPCVKILHNQNPFYTFDGFTDVTAVNAYPFSHVLLISDFCGEILRKLGVRHPMSRVRPPVPQFFKPKAKKFQIAYSPRKRGPEGTFLSAFFKARFPEYAHVPWIPLINMSREKAAEIMGETAIYAGLAWLESLGLMNLEAMASGCHVVGYVGHGGAEYVTPGNGDWIAEGDHDAFVEKLRDACRLFESGEENPRIAAGFATAGDFSQENFEANLHDAWTTILGENIAQYRL
jgi:hypothetical protein